MKNIDDVLKKIKQEFLYLHLTDRDFLLQIDKCLNNIKEKGNIYNKVYLDVSSYFYDYIGKNVDKCNVSDIYCFIEEMLNKNNKDIDAVLNDMRLFSLFLTNIGSFDERVDKYSDVLVKSKTISRNLSKIINTFGSQYPDFIDDDSLVILISNYIDKKGIILDDNINYDSGEEYSYDESVLDDVTCYIREITKYPILSAEEEKELAIRYHDYHDMDAREKLIKHNLRLCIKPTFKYRGRGVPQMDLIEYANMGLIFAIDRYNPHKGYRLSTYAIPWINQKLTSNFEPHRRIIGISRNNLMLLNRYNKSKKELYMKYGRDLSVEELAKELNMDLKNVNLYELMLEPVISGNTLVGEDGFELFDLIADDSITNIDDYICNDEENSVLSSVVSELSERDKIIIMLRYGMYDGNVYTLEEVASKLYDLGITDVILTHERIRQIEKRILRNFRKSKKLNNYYGKTKRKTKKIEE